jgi:hypothetical protein
MNIFVINKSTVLRDAQIQRWLPAFDVYADHVREWWPRAVSLVWCPRDHEPELAWKLVFADKSDQAGDLAYHDFTADGRPISYVFAADVEKTGDSMTVTATHEIAEMIADPWISENFQITDTRFFAKEICDPCEANEFAYSIKVGRSQAIKVSDFVLPKWFIPGSTGQFDRNKKIDKPLKILPGGYMSVFTPGRGWRQMGAKKGRRVAVLGNDPKSKGQFGRLTKYGRTRPVELGWGPDD